MRNKESPERRCEGEGGRDGGVGGRRRRRARKPTHMPSADYSCLHKTYKSPGLKAPGTRGRCSSLTLREKPPLC